MTEKTQEIRTTQAEDQLFGQYAVLVRQAGNAATQAIRFEDVAQEGWLASKDADTYTSGAPTSGETIWRHDLLERISKVTAEVKRLHREVAAECMARWTDHRDQDGTIGPVGEGGEFPEMRPASKDFSLAEIKARYENARRTERFVHLFVSPNLAATATSLLDSMDIGDMRALTGLSVDPALPDGEWKIAPPPARPDDDAPIVGG